MKRCPSSYVVRDMQDKTRYHCMPMRMAKVQNTNDTKRWRGRGATGTHTLWRGAEWQRLRRKTVWPVPPLPAAQNYSYHTIRQSCFLVFAQRNWKWMSVHKPARGCLFTAICNCPSLEVTKVSLSRRMGRLWDIQTMECHSALKGN